MEGVAWTIVDCYIPGCKELGPFPGREHRGPVEALKPMAVFYPGGWLLPKLFSGFLSNSQWCLGRGPFVALMGQWTVEHALTGLFLGLH